MHNSENWDDMRFVIAVAEAGTISGAARALGVNHATVLRRIAAFETQYGIEVFAKSARGYDLVQDSERIIEAVREVEAAVRGVARAIQGSRAPVSGVVRVTSTDTFCQAVLPDVIEKARQSAPGLALELLSTNAHLDLSRLHADITVRPALNLDTDLRGEVAARMRFEVYAARDFAGDAWLGLSGALTHSAVAGWFAENLGDAPVAAASDSFVTLRELAAHGVGRAVLPCVLGDADPRLEKLDGMMPEIRVPIWVASHGDLIDVPRIRAARAMLVEGLAAHQPVLDGQISAAATG